MAEKGGSDRNRSSGWQERHSGWDDRSSGGRSWEGWWQAGGQQGRGGWWEDRSRGPPAATQATQHHPAEPPLVCPAPPPNALPQGTHPPVKALPEGAPPSEELHLRGRAAVAAVPQRDRCFLHRLRSPLLPLQKLYLRGRLPLQELHLSPLLPLQDLAGTAAVAAVPS